MKGCAGCQCISRSPILSAIKTALDTSAGGSFARWRGSMRADAVCWSIAIPHWVKSGLDAGASDVGSYHDNGHLVRTSAVYGMSTRPLLISRCAPSRRYLGLIHQRIWWRIVAEIRHHPGGLRATTSQLTLSSGARLGSIPLFVGLRRFVFGITFPEDTDNTVAAKVRDFLSGAPAPMGTPSIRDAIFEQLPNL